MKNPIELKIRKDLLATFGSGLALLGVIAFLDDSVWWKCPIHSVTGLLCPGCGMQTALLKLLQGDFAGGFAANQTVLIGPILITLAFTAQRFSMNLLVRTLIAGTAIYTVAFTVLRNL